MRKSLMVWWVLLVAGLAMPSADGLAGVTLMPWKVGQFVEWQAVDQGAAVGTMRFLVAAKQAEGWVVEMRQTGKGGRGMVLQYLLKGIDQAMALGDSSKVDFGWIKMKQGDGPVRTLTESQLAMFGSVAKSSLESLVTKQAKTVDGGSVTVPAGTFTGTKQMTVTTSVRGQETEMTTWLHGSVPVNGMVQTRSADGSTELKLSAYGTNGKAELPIE